MMFIWTLIVRAKAKYTNRLLAIPTVALLQHARERHHNSCQSSPFPLRRCYSLPRRWLLSTKLIPFLCAAARSIFLLSDGTYTSCKCSEKNTSVTPNRKFVTRTWKSLQPNERSFDCEKTSRRMRFVRFSSTLNPLVEPKWRFKVLAWEKSEFPKQAKKPKIAFWKSFAPHFRTFFGTLCCSYPGWSARFFRIGFLYTRG